ncbi:hypothetical protein BH20ACT4_BH20ACT4_00750 [soil metagenome]
MTPAPLVAKVLPDVSGIDKEFDYLVPDELRPALQLGDVVRVPLHGRRVGGWVLGIAAHDGQVAVDRLRPIAKITGRGPQPDVVELARWAQKRWAARGLRPFLGVASPPRAVTSVPCPAARVAAPAPEPRDARAAELLAEGGGVLRVGPNADLVPVVSAAMALGPALVVVPGVDEARLLAARLRRRNVDVALVPDEWAAACGGVQVMVGTRTAVWAPCPELSVVIVGDEHDEALQEERSPTWHARDVAIERARQAQAPVVLVSPSPTVTALDWAPGRVRLPSVAESRAAWPLVDLVDRSREEPWKTSMLTSPLISALRDPERTVVCVHNAKGRARIVACRTCRALARCERCGAAVHVGDDRRFSCGRCGLGRPAVCQQCTGTGFANLRPGVARLRDDIAAAANRPAVAVTGDDHGRPEHAGVYVGTEAVLHRVDRADVVAFLDIDAELLAPRYRASEQAMALLIRAARLVGLRTGGGRLLVQTYLPRHEVLQAVLLADPGRMAAVEASRRRELGLPPYSALASVSGAGAEEFAAALAHESLTVGRRPGATQFLVRAPDWEQLGSALTATPRPPHSRLRIQVDPPRA